MTSPAPQTPTWYDLLGVEPTAGEEEIRAAWKAAIADLGPTDRRFATYNRAAEVLLDRERRAEYDAELAAGEPEPGPEESPTAAPAPTGPTGAAEAPSGSAARGPAARRAVPGWAIGVLGALALAMVAAAAWLHFRVPSDEAIEDSTRAARAAAERAVVPILSYDAARLEESRAAAESYMTPTYRKEYARFFQGVMEQNAAGTGTVVEASVVRSGVVRSGEDRVEVFVLLDQATTNKERRTPAVIKYWVTVTMQEDDGEWLVARMRTRA